MKNSIFHILVMAFCLPAYVLGQAPGTCNHYPFIKEIVPEEKGLRVNYELWIKADQYQPCTTAPCAGTVTSLTDFATSGGPTTTATSVTLTGCSGGNECVQAYDFASRTFKLIMHFQFVGNGEPSEVYSFEHIISGPDANHDFTAMLPHLSCQHPRLSYWVEHIEYSTTTEGETVVHKHMLTHKNAQVNHVEADFAEFGFNHEGNIPTSQLNYCYCLKHNVEPIARTEYVFSAWVLVEGENDPDAYENIKVKIQAESDGTEADAIPVTLSPKGPVIDGWQKIEGDFMTNAVFYDPISNEPVKLQIEIVNHNPDKVAYLDDIRLIPAESTIGTYVYDDKHRVSAILDDNNYAAFYQYNKKGELMRVNKETERGVMTIKEIRQNRAK